MNKSAPIIKQALVRSFSKSAVRQLDDPVATKMSYDEMRKIVYGMKAARRQQIIKQIGTRVKNGSIFLGKNFLDKSKALVKYKVIRYPAILSAFIATFFLAFNFFILLIIFLDRLVLKVWTRAEPGYKKANAWYCALMRDLVHKISKW
jgi:hypothetical protein